ncbi:sigma-70 family RNA polymerase sigma factor [Fulvivirga sp.]|uniref:RNA polymerase sigma factor n=1 Tax=Fulvivirga sp. TaxID=1931237 RepID=UPI0032ED9168
MTENEQHQTFDQWIKKYRALLFKVVRVYAHTPADQDDLFQEIAIQVYRSVPNFRSESAESTWLYRIALNTAMRWSTREKKHTHGHNPVEDYEYLLKASSTEKDERLDWLYDEISRFDEVDRSITLLLLDGLSYKEMSDVVGISESNIGVKIHRIKKLLTEKSKKYDYHGV